MNEFNKPLSPKKSFWLIVFGLAVISLGILVILGAGGNASIGDYLWLFFVYGYIAIFWILIILGAWKLIKIIFKVNKKVDRWLDKP